MRARAHRAAAAVLAALALAPRTASAQLSPGPLSRPHAGLEGAAGCLKCHEAGRGVAPSRCLSCHEALRARVAAGQGLHARDGFQACEKCHVEHHGRDFQLVFWGAGGMAAFDHAQTGHALQGGHARLACRSCHKPALVQDPRALQAGSVNLARTFLGLRKTCVSCHQNRHGGQFGSASCDGCHAQEAWKPAGGFRHDRTAFPLTGRHARVACQGCHPAARARPGDRQFKGVAFATCASCHRDVHSGRLGPKCASCHSTEGWQRVDRTAFDHDRTAFPLRGEHEDVACTECHRAGRPRRLAHARCADCHADPHGGQFARRPDSGRCESCHDVSGFRPSRFSTDEHQRTAFPLTGAHLAVPCDACHASGADQRGPARFRFASTRCADCHQDPHQGSVATFVRQGGCETCHVTDEWDRVRFDHGRTGFSLTGRHPGVPCDGCHRQASGAPGRLSFAGAPRDCAGCHEDAHAGQFVRDGRTACARCHGPASWAAVGFDHERDASFALTGAHRQVSCGACHKPEERQGRRVVRYRPLPSSCRACHGETARPAAVGRSS